MTHLLSFVFAALLHVPAASGAGMADVPPRCAGKDMVLQSRIERGGLAVRRYVLWAGLRPGADAPRLHVIDVRGPAGRGSAYAFRFDARREAGGTIRLDAFLVDPDLPSGKGEQTRVAVLPGLEAKEAALARAAAGLGDRLIAAMPAWEAPKAHLADAYADDPARARAGWRQMALSLEKTLKDHPWHLGALRDLLVAYGSLLLLEPSGPTADNLCALVPERIGEFRKTVGKPAPAEERWLKEVLARYYFRVGLAPLAAEALAALPPGNTREVLAKGLRALGQGEFAAGKPMAAKGPAGEMRIDAYEAAGRVPDKLLSPRWYFVPRRADAPDAVPTAWYVLSRHLFAGKARWYLHGHVGEQAKVLAFYGTTEPGIKAVQEQVAGFVQAALAAPEKKEEKKEAPPASGGTGAAAYGLSLAWALAAALAMCAAAGWPGRGGWRVLVGLLAVGVLVCAVGGPLRFAAASADPKDKAAKAKEDEDKKRKAELDDELKKLLDRKRGEEPKPAPEKPRDPPVPLGPSAKPVVAVAPPATVSAAKAPPEPAPVVNAHVQAVDKARQRIADKEAIARIAKLAGDEATVPPVVGVPVKVIKAIAASPPRRIPWNERKTPNLSEIADIRKQVSGAGRPGAARFDTVGEVARQATDRNADPKNPNFGTRFFSPAAPPPVKAAPTRPAGITSSPQLSAIARGFVVPPPPKPKPAVPVPPFVPKGVKILIDDRMLAEAMAAEPDEAALRAVAALEDVLVAGGDRAGAALREFVERRKTLYLEASRKFEAMEGAVLVSLRELFRKLAAHRGKWSERPAELRRLAGVSRIHGYLADEEAGDVLLVGRSVAGAPPIEVDDLVVGLRAVWRDGLVPGCSLDADPNDMGGRQHSRVIGVPSDSGFARVMLEADYAMKRILFEAPGEELGIPGYRSLKAIRQERGLGAPSVGRFWLYPVQPTGREIVLGPGGGSALFRARVQVLTEELAVSQRELVGTGRVSPDRSEAARSFTRHFDAIAAKRPIFRRLEGLFDIVLLAKVLRLAAPGDPLLEAICGLPHEATEVPSGYPAVTVTFSSRGGMYFMTGGCDARPGAGPAAMIEARSSASAALEKALAARKAGAVLSALEGGLRVPAGGDGKVAAEEQLQLEGMALFARGRLEEAKEKFSLAVEARLDFAPAYRMRAAARLELGEREEAALDCLAALQHDPDDVAALATYYQSFLEGGTPGALDGIPAEARRELALRYLGRAHLRMMQADYPAAGREIERAFRVEAAVPDGHFLRAMLRRVQGDYAGAADDLGRVLAVRPVPEFRAARAMCLFLAGKAEAALDDVDEVIRSAPAGAAAALLVQFKTAVRVGPARMRAWIEPYRKLPFVLHAASADALAAQGEGKHDRAAAAFEQALKLTIERAADPAVRALPAFRANIECQLMMETARAAPPARRAEAAKRIEEIRRGLRDRHPGWVCPDFYHALAMNFLGRFGDMAAALDRAEAVAAKPGADNDPVLSMTFDAARVRMAPFLLAWRLILVTSEELGRERGLKRTLEEAGSTAKRLAARLGDSPAAPAAKAMAALYSEMVRNIDKEDLPKEVLERFLQAVPAPESLRPEALSGADALVLTLCCRMAVMMQLDAPGLEGAEKAARSLFRLPYGETEHSPMLGTLPALLRAEVCKGIVRRYVREYRGEIGTALDAVRKRRLGADEAEKLFAERFAAWQERADRIGDPALSLNVREAIRKMGSEESVALHRGYLRYFKTLADPTPAQKAQLARSRATLERFAQREAKAIGEQVARAYREAATATHLRTLNEVLKELAKMADDPRGPDALAYRPPPDAEMKALRLELAALRPRKDPKPPR